MKNSIQWNKLNSLSKAIYVSEQVCVGWCRTGAYYTAKLTFSHASSVTACGVYYASVCIRFVYLWHCSGKRYYEVGSYAHEQFWRWKHRVSVVNPSRRSGWGTCVFLSWILLQGPVEVLVHFCRGSFSKVRLRYVCISVVDPSPRSGWGTCVFLSWILLQGPVEVRVCFCRGSFSKVRLRYVCVSVVDPSPRSSWGTCAFLSWILLQGPVEVRVHFCRRPFSKVRSRYVCVDPSLKSGWGTYVFLSLTLLEGPVEVR